MQAQCSLVFALILVVLCAKLDYCEKISEQVDESEDIRSSQNDTLSPYDVSISINATETPTSSSTRGDLIGDASSLKPAHNNISTATSNESSSDEIPMEENEEIMKTTTSSTSTKNLTNNEINFTQIVDETSSKGETADPHLQETTVSEGTEIPKEDTLISNPEDDSFTSQTYFPNTITSTTEKFEPENINVTDLEGMNLVPKELQDHQRNSSPLEETFSNGIDIKSSSKKIEDSDERLKEKKKYENEIITTTDELDYERISGLENKAKNTSGANMKNNESVELSTTTSEVIEHNTGRNSDSVTENVISSSESSSNILKENVGVPYSDLDEAEYMSTSTVYSNEATISFPESTVYPTNSFHSEQTTNESDLVQALQEGETTTSSDHEMDTAVFESFRNTNDYSEVTDNIILMQQYSTYSTTQSNEISSTLDFSDSPNGNENLLSTDITTHNKVTMEEYELIESTMMTDRFSEVSTTEENSLIVERQSDETTTVYSTQSTTQVEDTSTESTSNKEFSTSIEYQTTSSTLSRQSDETTTKDSTQSTTQVEDASTESTLNKELTTSEIQTSSTTNNIDTSTHTVITTTPEEIPSSCRDIKITEYEISTRKTSIKIIWTLGYSPNLPRCLLKINVSCNSIDGFDWVVTHQETLTSVENSKPVSYLDHLSEFTNYTCVGELFVDNGDQPILSSEVFNAITDKEVPSSIRVDIKNVTAKSFTLEWKRPEKIPGNLQMYLIRIKKKSMHYVRENCSMESIEITVPFVSEKDVIVYNFIWAEPNYLYEVQVLAQDEAGNSQGIAQTFATESFASTEPLNISTTLHNYANHCGDNAYNATLQLNWELPCNTNGELIGFEINVTEKIEVDEKLIYTRNSVTYKIPKNSDIKNVNYQLLVRNLNASSTYECLIFAISENGIHGVPSLHTSQRTGDGCPSEPSQMVAHLYDSSVLVEWKEPKDFYGKILDYNILVNYNGPKHRLSEDLDCREPIQLAVNETTNMTYFEVNDTLPHFVYQIQIQARTSAGTGNATDTKVLIPSKISEPVRKLKLTKIDEIISQNKYEYRIRIDFKEPCNTNGKFICYTIEEKGKRKGYPDIYNMINVSRTSYEMVLKKPDYQYEIGISVVTELFVSSAIRKSITTSAAIPTIDEEKIRCSVDDINPTILKVEMKKEMFNEDNGEILQYAVFLFEGQYDNSYSQEPSYGICNGNCPLVNRTTYPFIKSAHIYQITPERWNPFSDGSEEIIIYLGRKEHCSHKEFCEALSEDTNYVVLVRAMTKNSYRDAFIPTKTGITPSNASFFFISFIVFVVVILFGVYAYTKRSRLFTMFKSIPNTVIDEETSNLRHVVAVKHFISYYDMIQSDPTILSGQYEEIDEEIKKYKDENVHTTFALKPENKRKNRYTNILPYDEYRVKLNIDEDDEICSDYINASYIKGVTGEIEYIATQGPLEHTCKDFWKMVIQENVTVIVMVSQFVEKEKEKCFKYFPKNHENMLICEDLEVKCLTELQFDTYCVRTLLIKKDIRQYSVVHMQYLDWPDFGCPSGTYNMLSFCEEVRDRIQIEKGLMAVHCSAGVGRTGTLISLDILLQTIGKEKDISIFECVMDLRKQRTHMVQTEKQYVYIHTCLKDVLENSSLYKFDTKKNEDHTYENIITEKGRAKTSSQCEEIESAF